MYWIFKTKVVKNIKDAMDYKGKTKDYLNGLFLSLYLYTSKYPKLDI